MPSPFIPTEEYEKIVEQMPICCIDLLPIRNGKVLLSKRNFDPGKDGWFPVGGRVHKGERLLDAAIRKLNEELGVSLPSSHFQKLVVGETIFTGDSVDQNRHSINVVYTVTIPEMVEFTLDTEQLADVAWFSNIDLAWHPYVQEIIQTAFASKN